MKTVFLATLLGQSKPYSSREEAEKALAIYLTTNHSGFFNSHNQEWIGKSMLYSVARKEYDRAIVWWNDGIKCWHNGNTLYLAIIEECEIDARFV